MNRTSSARISTALLVPIILVLTAIALGAFLLLTRELPDCARPKAIQDRFKPQLAVLEALATSPEVDAFQAMIGKKDWSKEGLARQVEKIQAWNARAEREAPLFDDPAILGASVTIHSARSVSRMGVKAFDEPEGMIALPGGSQDEGYPSVTLWFTGTRFLAEYEARFPEVSGVQRGYRLFFDLERLKESGPSDP